MARQVIPGSPEREWRGARTWRAAPAGRRRPSGRTPRRRSRRRSARRRARSARRAPRSGRRGGSGPGSPAARPGPPASRPAPTTMKVTRSRSSWSAPNSASRSSARRASRARSRGSSTWKSALTSRSTSIGGLLGGVLVRGFAAFVATAATVVGGDVGVGHEWLLFDGQKKSAQGRGPRALGGGWLTTRTTASRGSFQESGESGLFRLGGGLYGVETDERRCPCVLMAWGQDVFPLFPLSGMSSK